MFAKLCAMRNKKGFTLAELLIVVAILAVLVAIAVPVFTSSLKKADDAVKDANFRSAKAVAAVKVLNMKDIPAKQAYSYSVDGNGNITLTTSEATTESKDTKTTGVVIITADDLASTT